MTVIAQQISIPSNGTPAILVTSEPQNSSSVGIRNTGTVAVLLGPSGAEIFPLMPNEFLGVSVSSDDVLMAVVQTQGTAGQITILGMD